MRYCRKVAKKTLKAMIFNDRYPNLVYGGEAQCDWDDFFPTLEEIDFTDKLVAIFGCGINYAEAFR